MREKVTAYTIATVIKNEQVGSLKEGILMLYSLFECSEEVPTTVRADAAPGFRLLTRDRSLLAKNITIELGHEKNVNKNPVAEVSLSELHNILARRYPEQRGIAETELVMSVNELNSKLRDKNLSAKELWARRCQFTGKKVNVDDKELIEGVQKRRERSHAPSARCKARGAASKTPPVVKFGDVIYLAHDRSKLRPRESCLVVEVNDTHCFVQKFVEDQLRARRYTVRLENCLKAPAR